MFLFFNVFWFGLDYYFILRIHVLSAVSFLLEYQATSTSPCGAGSYWLQISNRSWFSLEMLGRMYLNFSSYSLASVSSSQTILLACVLLYCSIKYPIEIFFKKDMKEKELLASEEKLDARERVSSNNPSSPFYPA